MSYVSIVIVLIFIMLDVVSGLLKAFSTTGFDSSVMRQGFFHKMAELLSVALCVVADELGYLCECEFFCNVHHLSSSYGNRKYFRKYWCSQP